MGTHEVRVRTAEEDHRVFMKRLLRDVRACERMLEQGMFEDGVRRIGAEQELFLVDRAWRPAPVSQQVLADIDDARVTTELARFNLEFNLDPLEFGGSALLRMEEQLDQLLELVRSAARMHNAHALLIGILPTLAPSDLGLDNMTDRVRYRELNEALTKLRGGPYQFRIKGTDELNLDHDSVMPEACNTSFQVHFQSGPDEFARLYNISQAATGPVLAAATNSPLLFGKRLWRETRIAVFQQALDTRTTSHHERSPRVSFGRGWLKGSVVEIFKEDIARFRVLLDAPSEEDAFEVLERGEVPQLKALRLHNSTIYRWNRACYGISANGKPHLRIENRVLPSGPTVVDEVANAALWFGIMSGMSDEHPDITEKLDFDHAKSNFLAAARVGLEAHMRWLGGRSIAARELLLKELLPLARAGLEKRGIEQDDIDRYLSVIAERVETERTGSRWLVDSMANLKNTGTQFERLSAVTAAALARQCQGDPVHTWSLAEIDEAGGWKQHYQRVEQIMTTDVYTVHKDDLIDLVVALMEWEHLRYVPVEDDDHKLVGLVSLRCLLRLAGEDLAQHRGQPVPVHSVMHEKLRKVGPDTPTLEAIAIMREEGIGCLPVVHDDRLIGVVTERTFLHLSRQLLEKTIQE
ncbi:MAG: CBS domain-containing protein [Myxococcales bacterium]|nr:CBS domain-containing protein [Myxococcales bacterium]